MKIVSLKRLGNIENELIEKYPDISFLFYDKADNIPDNEKKELEVLIGYDGEINERFIKSCPNLKWIAWYATGVNNLPLELSLIHISEPTRRLSRSRMPSSA